MFDENFITSANPPTALNMKAFQKAMDLVCPILYYGTISSIELGYVYVCKETEFNPEYIVCHPDDLETLKKTMYWRRFVHIKDEDSEKRLERLRKQIHAPLFVSDENKND